MKKQRLQFKRATTVNCLSLSRLFVGYCLLTAFLLGPYAFAQNQNREDELSSLLREIKAHRPQSMQYDYVTTHVTLDENGNQRGPTFVVYKGLFRSDRFRYEYKTDIYKQDTSGEQAFQGKNHVVWTGERTFAGNDYSHKERFSFGSTSAFPSGHREADKGRYNYPGFQADGNLIAGEHFTESLKRTWNWDIKNTHDPQFGELKNIWADIPGEAEMEVWLAKSDLRLVRGKITFDPKPERFTRLIIEVEVLNTISIDNVMIPSEFEINHYIDISGTKYHNRLRSRRSNIILNPDLRSVKDAFIFSLPVGSQIRDHDNPNTRPPMLYLGSNRLGEFHWDADPSGRKISWQPVTPYTGIDWKHGSIPRVEFDGAWFELVSINGVSTQQIVNYCKENSGDFWQKRFDHDIYIVLYCMDRLFDGLNVTLVLSDSNTGKQTTHTNVSMTNENWRLLQAKQAGSNTNDRNSKKEKKKKKNINQQSREGL